MNAETGLTHLTPKEVASLLHVHIDTLIIWRRRKQGPPYVRLGGGRIYYPRDDFERWYKNGEPTV